MTHKHQLVGVLAAVLSAVVPLTTLGALPESRIAELASRAAAVGQIRVIVQLDVPHVPEGRLQAEAVVQQRQAIASRQQALAAQVRGTGAAEFRRFRYIPFSVFMVNANAIRAIGRLPGVIGIQEDAPERPVLDQSAAIVGAPTAWAQGYDGSDQVIAVLDTGVDLDHPFFSQPGKIVAEACFSLNQGSGGAFYESLCPGGGIESLAPGSGDACPSSIEDCFHGTHVAGIVAGDDGSGPYFGVARGARIISIQVFSNRVCQSDCGSYVGEAITFSADQTAALEQVYAWRDMYPIAAVNMSLGGFLHFDEHTCDEDNPSRKAAIDNLRSVGIATVVASGNFGSRTGMFQPACISSAVSVGATTNADQVYRYSNIASFIDLLAPGEDITSASAGGGLRNLSGTSMAAPHVAGAWAILRQAGPAASVDHILALLKSTGTLVDDTRSSGEVTGMARINIDAALSETVGQFPEVIFDDGFEQ